MCPAFSPAPAGGIVCSNLVPRLTFTFPYNFQFSFPRLAFPVPLGGIVYSNLVTTVSPNYANETLTGGGSAEKQKLAKKTHA